MSHLLVVKAESLSPGELEKNMKVNYYLARSYKVDICFLIINFQKHMSCDFI